MTRDEMIATLLERIKNDYQTMTRAYFLERTAEMVDDLDHVIAALREQGEGERCECGHLPGKHVSAKNQVVESGTICVGCFEEKREFACVEFRPVRAKEEKDGRLHERSVGRDALGVGEQPDREVDLGRAVETPVAAPDGGVSEEEVEGILAKCVACPQCGRTAYVTHITHTRCPCGWSQAGNDADAHVRRLAAERAHADRLRAKLQRVRDDLKFAANSPGGLLAEVEDLLAAHDAWRKESS
jgi:hypothetical protein